MSKREPNNGSTSSNQRFPTEVIYPYFSYAPTHQATKAEAKVDKLVNAGLIKEVQYLTWLANVVQVKKKMGKPRSASIYGA